ncbi:MAG: ABC transporter substrate-binding protein [Chloroflexales bacterium]|nr:ABC transporter substrate-binding protein [Chloroflexales bacterium]
MRAYAHLLTLVIVIVVIVACGGSPAATEPTTESSQENGTVPTAQVIATEPTTAPPTTSESPAAAASGSSPLTVTDASGFEVTLDSPAQRVVCLIDTCVDILAELGMEPVAIFDKLAFHPQFFGDQAANITQISGGFADPSIEDIAVLQPDLVVQLLFDPTIRETLTNIAPIYFLDPKTYEESVQDLRNIGTLTGRTSEAAQAEAYFDERLEAYKSSAPKDKKVLFIGGSPTSPDIQVVGDATASLFREVAIYPWESPADGAISLEELLAVDPDVLFVTTFAFGGESGSVLDQFVNNPIWQQLTAVGNDQVYEVDLFVWIGGEGTRSFNLILDEAMPKIYPETFPEPLP